MAEQINAERLILKVSREQYYGLVTKHKGYAENDMKKNHERLKRKYKSEQVKFVYKLEKVWEDCADTGDYTMVYKMLESDAIIKANKLSYNWNSKRLSHADFESVYWAAAWEVVEKRYDGTGRYFLYETITMVFYCRVNDFLRYSVEKAQGRFESGVLSLNEKNEKFAYSVSQEKRVTDKIFLDHFSSLLPAEDCNFVDTLKVNPDADNQELSKLLGYSHREQVRRKKGKIRNKLCGWPDYEMVFNEDNFGLSQGCRKGQMYWSNSEKGKATDPWMAIREKRRNLKAG